MGGRQRNENWKLKSWHSIYLSDQEHIPSVLTSTYSLHRSIVDTKRQTSSTDQLSIAWASSVHPAEHAERQGGALIPVIPFRFRVMSSRGFLNFDFFGGGGVPELGKSLEDKSNGELGRFWLLSLFPVFRISILFAAAADADRTIESNAWVDDMSIIGNLSFSPPNSVGGIWEQLRFSSAAAAAGFRKRVSKPKLAAVLL